MIKDTILVPIKESKNQNGSIVYKYCSPNTDELYDRVGEILEVFKMFVEAQNDIKMSDIEIDEVLFGEAALRIDKRQEYFVLFHDETIINEVKKAALWSYWLIKFKPIHIKKSSEKALSLEKRVKYKHINEGFAVFMVYAIVLATSRRCGVSFHISKEYNKRIVYAFKYWHLNKSALMMIAESLCAHMDT